jgi:hypothetical protein
LFNLIYKTVKRRVIGVGVFLFQFMKNLFSTASYYWHDPLFTNAMWGEGA